MLLSLLVAAVVGVASVLLEFTALSMQLIASALTLVTASALLLPLGRPASDARPSLAATVWFVFIAAGASLVMANVWTVTRSSMPGTLQILTLAWLGYGFPTSFVLLAALRRSRAAARVRHVATARTAVIGACLAFGAAVPLQVSTALGGGSIDRASFVPVAFCVVLSGVVVAAGTLASFRRPADAGRAAAFNRAVGVCGFVAALVASAAWTAIVGDESRIWRVPMLHEGDELVRMQLAALVMTSGFAISVAMWCPLSNLGFRDWARALPAAATSLTLALAGTLAFAVAARGTSIGEDPLLGRGLAALAILDACVLLSIAVLLRARRAVAPTEDSMRAMIGLEMKCPRCATPRFAGVGESACPECRLVLLLGFRDDFCPTCRYDLRATGDAACPECGRPRQVPATATVR